MALSLWISVGKQPEPTLSLGLCVFGVGVRCDHCRFKTFHNAVDGIHAGDAIGDNACKAAYFSVEGCILSRESCCFLAAPILWCPYGLSRFEV